MLRASPFAPDVFLVVRRNIPDGRNVFRKPEECTMRPVTVSTAVLESAPITGAEVQAGNGSGFKAVVKFHRAFNSRALSAMQDNWLNADEIAMDNPLGGIRRGWTESAACTNACLAGQRGSTWSPTITPCTRHRRCSRGGSRARPFQICRRIAGACNTHQPYISAHPGQLAAGASPRFD